MKRLTASIVFLMMTVLLWTGPAWAAETRTVAVLPFSIHSAENIDYIKNGIWDMLMSRLAASDKLEVLRKDTVSEALGRIKKKELTAADVYGLGKTLEVDFVVWGSVTKIGSNLSLDGKLLDVAAYTSPVGIFEQCRGVDEVVPKIDSFARKITYHLLGQVPPAFTAPPAPAPAPVSEPVKPPAGTPQETMAIEALKTPKGTFTSVINPDFINAAQPMDRQDFWMTRRYPVRFKGMDIGDVNGDGSNEIVIIDNTSVMIYQKGGTDLTLITKIDGSSYDNHFAVDVADINGNGIPEIIVSSMQGNNFTSFVVEFREGKFVRIASGLRLFLRVIETSDGPLLMGQSPGVSSAFENPIHEIVWKGGAYEKGDRMPIPEGLSVYGLTLDTIDGTGRKRVITLDEYDHLRVYEKTTKHLSKLEILGGSDELLYKSDEVFGGSSNALNYRPRGGAGSENWADEPETAYVNVRILTYDINRDGRNDIIIVNNISETGRLLKNVRSFSRSEICNLQWDRLGMTENWRTRPIRGYVSDYQFKDVDNDGNNELVLALVLSSGQVGTARSVMVAYDLREQ